jgi:predicted alpha/beta-hydrolase family hydrolase
MQTLKRKITVLPETIISSIWAIPQDYDDSGRNALILAHGAGNDMNNPFLSYVYESMARRGMLSVKFNFPYMEHGRKAPDRALVLENTWRAVIQSVRQDAALRPRRLFLSGKSLGGRMASHLAAQGEDCVGLIYLGYPLHPPNNGERLRAEHLSRIRCPMLFIEGTRDPLCDLTLLDSVLSRLGAPTTLHTIEGGDHSFNVLFLYPRLNTPHHNLHPQRKFLECLH